MKVGWLRDEPGYVGGAELTQAEFRAAAPEGVEVVDCPPGCVDRSCDVFCIHNCGSYSLSDVEGLDAPLVRYVHDTWTYGDPALRSFLLSQARLIFTSPLHVERFPHPVSEPKVIPPALDLERFRAVSNGHREGAVCIGRMAYGKGLELLSSYPEPVDVYSTTPCPSEGNARYRGATEDVASTLARYERFVFLPTALEPFGRGVVEAWAAGCEIVVNRNVGARYFIEENPEALESAAEDFWAEVLR